MMKIESKRRRTQKQVKADKAACQRESKLYENCHAGVMGIGNFEGRKNCGQELEVLYKCLFSS